MSILPFILKEQFQELREKATNSNMHGRIPEMISWHYLGFSMFLEYAKTAGVVSNEGKEELLTKAWDVLLELGYKQSGLVRKNNPSENFLVALQNLLIEKSVYVLDLEQPDKTKVEPGCIGYHDKDFFYLEPDLVLERVKEFCRLSGDAFPFEIRTLLKDLDRNGYIHTTSDGTGRFYRTIFRNLDGEKNKRWIQLKVGSIIL